MTDNKDLSIDTEVKSVIIREPAYFYAAEKTSLEERLKLVNISQEEIERFSSSQGKKVVRDAVLGSFLIGKAAKAMVDWNEGVDKAIKEAKKRFLIELYFDKSDETERAVENLKEFITNPAGNVLFNKLCPS